MIDKYQVKGNVKIKSYEIIDGVEKETEVIEKHNDFTDKGHETVWKLFAGIAGVAAVDSVAVYADESDPADLAGLTAVAYPYKLPLAIKAFNNNTLFLTWNIDYNQLNVGDGGASMKFKKLFLGSGDNILSTWTASNPYVKTIQKRAVIEWQLKFE